MSNSTPSSTKKPTKPPANIGFWIFSALILTASAAGLAFLWPAALHMCRSEADRLVWEGSRVGGSEAETDYKLAVLLNGTNKNAYLGLAKAYLGRGKADESLVLLDRAGEGTEINELKVRALMELGRYSEAADSAQRLVVPGAGDRELVLAALANAAAGRDAANESLIPRLESPEAAGSVLRAQAGSTPFAAELYAVGLLRSASTLLMKQSMSFERNFLLAQIRYEQHAKSDLVEAVGYLNPALTINPTDVEARQLLAKIYRDQGDLPAAYQQDSLIKKLQTGRP